MTEEFVPTDGGEEEDSGPAKFILSEGMYKVIKQLVQVILPAFSAAYFGLASIWGLPSPEKVVGTIAVITTFLGVTLGISVKNYKSSGLGVSGQMVVKERPGGGLLYSLEVDGPVEDLAEMDAVTFKVVHPDDEEEPEPV